jgi:hypothetical protein
MQSDFDRWLEYHATAYGGFGKWVAENNDQVRFMRRLLEAYTIDELQAATDRLYALDEQPRGYGEHARRIRQLIVAAGGHAGQSDSIGPRVIDEHLTAECWRCLDYGIVSVLSPATLKRLRTQSTEHSLTTCVVACNCRRGNAARKRLVQWADGHCLIRIDDVLDAAVDQRRDMWDVACDMVRQRDEELRPHAVELSGDVLP